MKKLLLCVSIIGIFNFSIAQTGNENLGGSVTPENNAPMSFNVFSIPFPVPYNGSTVLSAPGSSLSTGDYNTLLGDGAGGSLTTGLQCVFIGTAAGALLDNDSDNTIIGAFAKDLSSLGGDNVIIGARAARTSTGFDNVVIGNEAGLNMTTAVDNVIIGEEAGESLTSGGDNVFIGEDAGLMTTTANDNTFVGNLAGRQNTTGTRNAFFGNEAGYDNTIGDRNTFIGDSVGIDIGVGRLNTFVGQAAGASTEFANFNTFIGARAGWDNNRTNGTTNANNNTYVGFRAGQANREGQSNVGMGSRADFAAVSGSERNVFIGADTRVRGQNNVLLGYNARTRTSSDGNNQIVIGANSQTLESHSIIIGNDVTISSANTMALGGDTTTNRLSVGIGTTGASQNASLELADTDKGFLVNRVTTAQRNTMITTPASGTALGTTDEGLIVYDSDLKSLFVWTGSTWQAVGTTACSAPIGQVTNVVFGTSTDTSLTVSGFAAPKNGATGYAIYINDTNSFIAPTDGDTPVANPVWNNGGQQAVYFGTSVFSNVIVTGLSSGTEYFFQVYAYNDCDNSTTFETNGFNVSDITEALASVDMVGGIGIGTSSPSTAMDVDGSVRALNRNDSGTLYKCDVNVEGTFGYDTEDKVLKVCTINSGNYEWRALSFK